MKEKPILFNTAMIKAILAGRKTKTRRVMNPQQENCFLWDINQNPIMVWRPSTPVKKGDWIEAPYQRGMRLWVKETWATGYETMYHKPAVIPPGTYVEYKATPTENAKFFYKWRPSIFMPRWASRLNLEVVDVKVERLWEMTINEMIAEGVQEGPEDDGKHQLAPFIALWNELNANRGFGWQVNPWVWVVEFKLESASRSAQQAVGADATTLPDSGVGVGTLSNE